jgi:hypothetical protein
MKKDNNSPYFKDWTTSKLKEEAVAYDELINGVGCYGKRELMSLQGILAELEDRKVEITSKLSFN